VRLADAVDDDQVTGPALAPGVVERHSEEASSGSFTRTKRRSPFTGPISSTTLCHRDAAPRVVLSIASGGLARIGTITRRLSNLAAASRPWAEGERVRMAFQAIRAGSPWQEDGGRELAG